MQVFTYLRVFASPRAHLRYAAEHGRPLPSFGLGSDHHYRMWFGFSAGLRIEQARPPTPLISAVDLEIGLSRAVTGLDIEQGSVVGGGFFVVALGGGLSGCTI